MILRVRCHLNIDFLLTPAEVSHRTVHHRAVTERQHSNLSDCPVRLTWLPFRGMRTSRGAKARGGRAGPRGASSHPGVGRARLDADPDSALAPSPAAQFRSQCASRPAGRSRVVNSVTAPTGLPPEAGPRSVPPPGMGSLDGRAGQEQVLLPSPVRVEVFTQNPPSGTIRSCRELRVLIYPLYSFLQAQ